MADRDKSRRLFAGIRLDDLTRAACAAAGGRLQRTGFPARYEAADKLHVTLAFLGNVAQSQYDAVIAALEGAAGGNVVLELTLDKLGAFPHERRPRVVYVGAREQGAPFRALARRVHERYAALGFTFVDDPVAHVTIARVKEPQCPLPIIEFAPIALRADSLTLFESIFDSKAKTSRYEVRGEVPLSS
ncbi:MAG: RNA 2',3'-cyclic phosphodiesterase [Candidatus Cybelea sp.]